MSKISESETKNHILQLRKLRENVKDERKKAIIDAHIALLSNDWIGYIDALKIADPDLSTRIKKRIEYKLDELAELDTDE